MIGFYLAVLAGIVGLAFGSFLNVCATRWPQDESVVRPRSHCRSCGKTLSWWENVPFFSWVLLRGRCRSCNAAIGWRYPFVEISVALLWAITVWQFFADFPDARRGVLNNETMVAMADVAFRLIFLWLLVALAVLDAENFWLPDRLIWPGIGAGLILWVVRATISAINSGGGTGLWQHLAGTAAMRWFLGAVIPGGIVLIIRTIYKWLRGQEGIGLGDVKLMMMLGGWLGIQAALLSFGIGAIVGAVVALIVLARPGAADEGQPWGLRRLPLGTFICAGAIISTFWGVPIIAAYRRWAGL